LVKPEQFPNKLILAMTIQALSNIENIEVIEAIEEVAFTSDEQSLRE
jgi:hypothetical protein